MHRIGFDTSALDPTFKAHAHRGIGRYVRALNEYFEQISFATADYTIATFSHRSITPPRIVESCIAMLPCGRHTVRQQLCYPIMLGRAPEIRDTTLLHFPAHLDAPSWSRQKTVVTVLDLIPLVLADLYKSDHPGWRFQLARSLEIAAIKAASHIITISEHSARDITAVLGIPREKISITPLGVDDKFYAVPNGDVASRIESRYGINPSTTPYILYVGGIDQRKNVGMLIDTLAEVAQRAERSGRAIPKLVLAGSIAQDRQYPALQKKIQACGVRHLVIETGFVADSELIDLLACCAVFFFPSLYEGFGLTPLEAMAAGAPVVSSGASAMKEVLSDAALLVDPSNGAECIEAVEQVLHDTTLQQDLKSRGVARARQYTWRRTGETTVEAYRQALRSLA